MWLVLLAFLLVPAQSFYVNLDVKEKECFYEIAEAGQMVKLLYEVPDGGFNDIDTTLYAPDDTVLIQEQASPSGRPVITAKTSGKYKVCFGNEHGSLAPKLVMFDVMVYDDHVKPEDSDDEEQRKLTKQVNTLSNAVETVMTEMEYVTHRTDKHWQTNKSTNSRVVLWAIFEVLLIIIICFGQIFYLKRFFEVRRMV